jgi:hypothetical protein
MARRGHHRVHVADAHDPVLAPVAHGSVLASVAVLATLLVVGSIEGLSQHYGAEAQVAIAKPVSVAQR